MTLPNAAWAGMRLFCLVFAAGFALGMIRETGLRPLIGADAARLVELPLMVAISFFAARWILRRGGQGDTAWLLVMGLVAFLLLMAAELTLGSILFGRGVSAFLGDIFTLTGFLAFVAQALLIVMPRLAASGTCTPHGRPET
jgi:hypothetical protein